MLNRQFVIAGLVAGMFMMTACSQQTKEHVDAGQPEAAAESAGQDAQMAVQEAGTEVVDATQTAGAVATGAAINTGEAIADGANEVTAGAASVASDAATAVAEGADSVAQSAQEAEANAHAEAASETDIQVDTTTH